MAEPENRSNELPGAFSLFRPSLNAIMVNLVTLIELVAVPLLVVGLGGVLKNHGGSVITPFGEILALVLAPAAYLTQLMSVQNKKIDFTKAIKESMHYFWRLIGLAICVGVVVGIGFILLIVPGLIMLRRYILSPYYLLDRDMKIFDAMRASAAESKQFSGAIWGLIGVEILISLASAVISILLGPLSAVGFLVYYTYYCAPAIRYLEIKRASKPSSAAAPIV